MSRDEPDSAPATDPRPIESAPARSRDDELLADPPQGEHHRGRLAGYEAGRGARRLLFVGLMIGFVGTFAAWLWYATREPPQSRTRQFQLPAGTDLAARPRVFTWSEGKAQLGLSREPPGVDTVELPDRTLRLAPGSELARFKVVVKDGRTEALDVLSGAVLEELKPGAPPLLAPR